MNVEARREQMRAYAQMRRERDPEGMRAYKRQWRLCNPEKIRAQEERRKEKAREYSRRWREKNREKYLEQHRADGRRSRLRHAGAIRLAEIRLRYGLSEAQYQELVLRHKGRCAICGNEESRRLFGKIKRLAIDHEHQTGKIRGLLCHNCNTMIALAKENSKVLKAAAEYLESAPVFLADREAEGW